MAVVKIIQSLKASKMYIVLSSFPHDIIPSKEVAVLSVSLAILEELKHKTKATEALLIHIETGILYSFIA